MLEFAPHWQLAKSGEAALAHILVLQEKNKRCGTKSNTLKHMDTKTNDPRESQQNSL